MAEPPYKVSINNYWYQAKIIAQRSYKTLGRNPLLFKARLS